MNTKKLETILKQHSLNNPADLRGADLQDAELQNADLHLADLQGTHLRHANLQGANLHLTNLHGADLHGADLQGADLQGANLQDADLQGANLRGAQLRGANLRDTQLRGANLSSCKGLLNAAEWIRSNFVVERDYIIVYKRIGQTTYPTPLNWSIEENSVLTEVVHPDRTLDCACGINFGTLKWCSDNYTAAQLWACKIEFFDLADVVVPYNTDGKARCGRLTLLYKCDNEGKKISV
jgi:hypothetical protein